MITSVATYSYEYKKWVGYPQEILCVSQVTVNIYTHRARISYTYNLNYIYYILHCSSGGESHYIHKSNLMMTEIFYISFNE